MDRGGSHPCHVPMPLPEDGISQNPRPWGWPAEGRGGEGTPPVQSHAMQIALGQVANEDCPSTWGRGHSPGGWQCRVWCDVSWNPLFVFGFGKSILQSKF